MTILFYLVDYVFCSHMRNLCLLNLAGELSLLSSHFIIGLLYFVKILLLISDIVQRVCQCELCVILLLFELSDAEEGTIEGIFNVEFSIELNYKLEEILKQGLVFEILKLMIIYEVFEFCKA